jgi:mannose-6-phosphate isomerase
MDMYPLKLTCHVRSYAFGDRLIPERLGKPGMPDGIVAESWEVSDYRGAVATVRNGSLAGRSLHELVQAEPEAIVGAGWRGPHFPLLEKLLDASHMLPVHLHADDATARRKYAEPNGKTEAWHILWAVEGASVLAGVRPGLTDEALTAAFLRQDYDSVMVRHPIHPGDTVYVPGGVLHAFGPDTLIFEVQQTSDLAQTVMPTDLYGTRLDDARWRANIAETLDELRRDVVPRPNPGLELEAGANRRTLGCAGPHFALERWALSRAHVVTAGPRRCTTLTNLGEPATLHWSGGRERLGRAESCILPAALERVEVTPGGDGDLVACYLPDLERDVLEPLLARGHDREAIAALGELPAA